MGINGVLFVIHYYKFIGRCAIGVRTEQSSYRGWDAEL